MSPLRNMAFNTGAISPSRKPDRIEVFVGSPERESPEDDGVDSTNLRPEIQKTMLRETNARKKMSGSRLTKDIIITEESDLYIEEQN